MIWVYQEDLNLIKYKMDLLGLSKLSEIRIRDSLLESILGKGKSEPIFLNTIINGIKEQLDMQNYRVKEELEKQLII